MERFSAMVSSRRAAAAPAPGPDEEEAKENGKRNVAAEDEAYLRIQLEEIVIVKNEDFTSPGAARCSNNLGGASAGAAASTAPAGSSAATTAARGVLSTTVGWIVGSN